MALQPFVGPRPRFQFLDLYTGGRTLWTGDLRVARPLPNTQNKRTQTSTPRVGIEPIPQCLSGRIQFMP
jgi:hypothetical protein